MSEDAVVGALLHGAVQPQHLGAALLDPPGSRLLHAGVPVIRGHAVPPGRFDGVLGHTHTLGRQVSRT